MTQLHVVDFFAGCGGLSLGLEAAGLTPLSAVELSPMAAETHYKNFHLRGNTWDPVAWDDHLDLASREEHVAQALEGTVIGDITKLVDDRAFLNWLRDETPAVLAGGPPCQGFSMAGKRNPADSRNRLPWDFLTMVEAANPKVVVVENVLGINRAFRSAGREEAPLAQLKAALMQTGNGYEVQAVEVNARHFGVPQNRPRMMLIGLRSDLARVSMITESGAVWQSSKPDVAAGPMTPTPSRDPEIPALEAIGDLTDTGYLLDLDDPGYRTYLFAHQMRTDPRASAPSAPLNQVTRKHTELTSARFALYHVLRDRQIPNSILSIPYEQQNGQVHARLSAAFNGDTKLPSRWKKWLEPFGTDLAEVAIALKTKKHSQRAIPPSSPAPTVVTLPDDFVHPTKPRIMTVRELARFQSFPDWFEFRSKETTGSSRRRFEVPQYSQVGNAVPPLLAQAVGTKVRELAGL